MHRLIVLALLSLPASLRAQQGTVSPGMTRAQVESALGAPATARTVSDHSYLFYRNSCGRACGMNDLVILHGDSVVDAIFRSPERQYTGESSSPAETRPQVARRRAPSRSVATKKEAAAPAKTTTTPAPGQMRAPAKTTTTPAPGQMRAPAQANDTRPSIPLNEPKMKPAASAPAKAPPKDAKPAVKPAAARQ